MSVNKKNVQKQITELLLNHASETAQGRFYQRATQSKQSLREVAWRTAGNLLNSGVDYKPGGFVK